MGCAVCCAKGLWLVQDALDPALTTLLRVDHGGGKCVCSPLRLVCKVNQRVLVGDGLGLQGQQHPVAEGALHSAQAHTRIGGLRVTAP